MVPTRATTAHNQPHERGGEGNEDRCDRRHHENRGRAPYLQIAVGGEQFAAVKDVFDLQMGKTPSRDVPGYWNNGDNDWVSIKDLGSYDKYVGRTKETISDRGVAESRIKSVPANTLIMSFKLSLGKTAITVAPTYTNEAIMAFLDKKTYPIDLDYMYHQFSTKD